MEVVILSGAEADLDEIYLRSEDGEGFLQDLDRRLELLRTFPLSAPASFLARVRKLRIGRTHRGFFTVSKEAA